METNDGEAVVAPEVPSGAAGVFRSSADALARIKGDVAASTSAPQTGTDGADPYGGMALLGRILDELVELVERLSATVTGTGSGTGSGTPTGTGDAGDARDAGARPNRLVWLPRRAPALEPNFVDRELAWADRAVAELLRLEAAMEFEAAQLERERHRYDVLTGVLDRRAGIEALGLAIDRCRRHEQPLVVAFVDVDGLKHVNDTYGHGAGDLLLVGVAAALNASLRSYDLVFRLGGDEFVCCVDDADVAAATERFEAVKRQLAAACEGASVSIGLAELRPSDTPETIIARADTAMYASRRRFSRSASASPSTPRARHPARSPRPDRRR